MATQEGSAAYTLLQMQMQHEQQMDQTPQTSQQRAPDRNVALICRDCKDPVPVIVEAFSDGDLVCGNCGLVLGNRIIDTRSEWRTFANSDEGGDDPSRVGAASDPLNPTGLDSTVISARDGGTGRSRDLNRAHQKAVVQRAESNLMTAFKSIQAMGDRISLTKIVVDSAKQIFKELDEKKTLKGKPQEAAIAACLFIACREHNVSRTFREICDLCRSSKKDVGKCFKLAQTALRIPTQQVTLSSYISRYASMIDMKADAIRVAQKVASRVEEHGTLAGKSTLSLVAACLYFASSISSEPISARRIADAVQCTESTLRNAYRSLYEQRHVLGANLGLQKGIESLPHS